MMSMEDGTLDMTSEDESALELGFTTNDTTDADEVWRMLSENSSFKYDTVGFRYWWATDSRLSSVLQLCWSF